MSGKIEVLEDGTELHYTEDGRPWYWVPPQEVKLMKEVNEKWEKELAQILWGKR